MSRAHIPIRFTITRMARRGRDSALRAFCDVLVSDLLLIRGVRVVRGPKGLFVAMPRQKRSNGSWAQSVVAMDAQLRAELNRVVLNTYGRALRTSIRPGNHIEGGPHAKRTGVDDTRTT